MIRRLVVIAAALAPGGFLVLAGIAVWRWWHHRHDAPGEQLDASTVDRLRGAGWQ